MKFLYGLAGALALSGCTAPGNLTLPEYERTVLLALDANTRQQGLSHRPTLPKDGMLFALPREQVTYFWMKDTFIPLNLFAIDQDQCVINKYELTPMSLETVAMPREAVWALETSRNWDLSVGSCFSTLLPSARD